DSLRLLVGGDCDGGEADGSDEPCRGVSGQQGWVAVVEPGPVVRFGEMVPFRETGFAAAQRIEPRQSGLAGDRAVQGAVAAIAVWTVGTRVGGGAERPARSALLIGRAYVSTPATP